MYQAYKPALRVISTVVLSFFIWSFGGVFDIAYAVKDSGQKAESRSQKGNITPPDLPLPQVEGKRPEEKFSKAIEDIDDILKDDKSDHDTKKQRIRSKKAEIDLHDIEIRKQFIETEQKIKDLPDIIKKRHREFVKKYDENLKELRSNLDSIGKAKNKTETDSAIGKAKAHLEKVRPPKRHQKLDPNKLPHRAEEPVFKEPRTKPEEFEKDSGQQSAMRGQTGKFADGFVGKVSFPLVGNPSEERLRSSRSDKGDKPILVAANGSLDGLLSANTQYITKTSDPLPDGSYQIALANPPSTADLAETIEVQFTPEIREIATLLENNPVHLYEFVRNNFEFDPYYGSVKGSQSTLLLQSGNDFDQASVLIALLRVSGIPTRYVYGTVEIPIEKVMKWVGGVTDPNVAATIMATGGIPGRLITEAGQIKYAQMEHVWVEAYLPYGNYRGIVNDPNAPKAWIPLDPSFKLYEPNPNAIDLAELQGFNINDYLAAYLQSIKPKTPAKDYLKTTIDYVGTNLPGQNFYDLLASATIIDKVLDLLPDTLPYPVIVTGQRFSTVPESYSHNITVELTDANYSETLLNYTASWSALLHKRFTLSYVPASATDEATIARYGGLYSTPSYLIQVKPVLSVEGTAVVTGSSVNMASDIVCQMNIAGIGGKRNLITNTLTVGATYAIGLGSGNTNGRIITYRTAKLDAAVTAGQSGEPILGEYLNLLAMNYLQGLDSSRKMVAGTMKILDKNAMAELMVGVDLGVTYLYGTPLNVSVNGVTIDADYVISAAFDMGGDQTKVRRYRMLTGLTSSALEHTVFEAITGIEAISAVKALQLAGAQGIPIHRIDLSNVSEKLPLLQLSNEVVTDIRNAVAAGKVVTVSELNVQLNNWNGVGYIVLDPNNGTGGYMISGGLSGGTLTGITQILEYLLRTGSIDKAEAKRIFEAHKHQLWFPMPVEGSITSRFNSPRSYGLHKAIDLSVNNWTPVIVVADGIVTEAKYDDAYTSSGGFYIIVDHGAGVETRYLHNCQLNVSVNQHVIEGDIIALSGNTGHITSSHKMGDPLKYVRCQIISNYGSHLHFELRLNGNKIDPEEYLRLKWE